MVHVSPITAMPWISISMPGRAKFVTVMSALAGKLPSGKSPETIVIALGRLDLRLVVEGNVSAARFSARWRFRWARRRLRGRRV